MGDSLGTVRPPPGILVVVVGPRTLKNREAILAALDGTGRAFLLAAAHPGAVGGVFNLGGVGRISLRELAETLIAVAGQGRYVIRQFPAERKKIDIGDYYSDDRLIRRQLGWRPRTSIRQALALTVDYYRQELPHYV